MGGEIKIRVNFFLFLGGGSNYGVQGMEVRNPRLRGKFNDGESSEHSSSRERINDRSRRRISTESSPKDRKNTLNMGTR